jgi:hypothetical protein
MWGGGGRGRQTGSDDGPPGGARRTWGDVRPGRTRDDHAPRHDPPRWTGGHRPRRSPRRKAADDGRRWCSRLVGRRQQRERVLVAEGVGVAADAEVESAVARGNGPDRRARRDRRVGADGQPRQREIAHAPTPAPHAHHATAAGDRPGVDHRAAACRADRRARAGGEVDAAVRSARERRCARVGEGARDLAWDRPQPSLSQGGGGDRQRHKDRGDEGNHRGRDGESGRGRGGAHATNLRAGRSDSPGCAWIGAEVVQS